MKDSGLSKEDIDDVVLVGGSTRIPKIQTTLKEYFNGKDLSYKINPDEAVAAGAAVHAFNIPEAGEESKEEYPEQKVKDVTPQSLGIAAGAGGKTMSKIIPKNTSYPHSKTMEYTNASENAHNMPIKIGQGESDEFAQNHMIGNFKLSIPAAPKSSLTIRVSFEVDNDGLLHVSAEETS